MFARSIRGLQLLNKVGYGVTWNWSHAGPGPTTPGGVFLAPPASSLEGAYKGRAGRGVRNHVQFFAVSE